MYEIPQEIMEVLQQFKWDNPNIKQLLIDARTEHGENGLQACLEVALER